MRSLAPLTHFPAEATEAEGDSRTQGEAQPGYDQKLVLLAEVALLITPLLLFALLRAPHAPQVIHATVFSKACNLPSVQASW